MFSQTESTKESTPFLAGMDILYIPPGTDIDGPTQAVQSIWVDGTVNGALRTEDKIIISEKATIHGAVWAQSAQVGGAVEGGLKVSGSLLLEATARIQGDIAADRLRIEEGAQFTGDCRMDAPDRTAEPEGSEAFTNSSRRFSGQPAALASAQLGK